MKFFKKKIFSDSFDPTPYMIRWTIFECSRFQIFVHKFLRTDNDCLHDHPWDFTSIILKGGYKEQNLAGTIKVVTSTNALEDQFQYKTRCKKYKAFNIIKHNAEDAHRIEIDKPCLTIMFTGRWRRLWGFYTPNGWVNWRDYAIGKENKCNG